MISPTNNPYFPFPPSSPLLYFSPIIPTCKSLPLLHDQRGEEKKREKKLAFPSHSTPTNPTSPPRALPSLPLARARRRFLRSPPTKNSFAAFAHFPFPPSTELDNQIKEEQKRLSKELKLLLLGAVRGFFFLFFSLSLSPLLSDRCNVCVGVGRERQIDHC